jgi:hypothetical protein
VRSSFHLPRQLELNLAGSSRAWLQGQNPIAAMKLVTIYLPLDSIPQRSALMASEYTHVRHLQRIGGEHGLARLYREAGILYMEGLGNQLMSSSAYGLSSSPFSLGHTEGGHRAGVDLEATQRYFRRARHLDPALELPDMKVLAANTHDLIMPSVEIEKSLATVKRDYSPDPMESSQVSVSRRRRNSYKDSEDDWSYLYLPGLLGAGLAVGLVGVMSVSWWRRSNS